MNIPIENAQSVTIPAPVAGLNTRDPLDGMDVFYAVEMDNWFPEERSIKVRGGTSLFCEGLGGTVNTLVEHVTAAGVRSFIAVAGTTMWDITTGAENALETALNSSKWQSVCMNNITVLMSGADQPQQWNGTATSDAVYTGISDDADLIQGTNYRNRLWFVDVDGKVWYGGVRSVTGALTEFPIAYEFQKGGYPMWVATWTRGRGDVTQDLFVCCTSEGEVLIYAGSSPDTDAFVLVGRVFLGKPLGRRSYSNVGTELEILTEDGIIPLSRVVTDPLTVHNNPLTDKIFPSYNLDAANYGTNFGWQGCVYPRGRYALYNVPIIEGTQSGQYVRNLYTGAWTRFTGWNACCFSTFNKELYFGAPGGYVFKADTGMDDNGSNIQTRVSFAFNYLGNRENLKKLAFFRPIIVSNESVTFSTGADVDFESTELVDTVTTAADAGALWDEEDWDVADWSGEGVASSDWYALTGLGRCVSLKLRADLSGVQPSMTAVHMLFQPGGDF